MRETEQFTNLVEMFFARAATKGNAPFLWAKTDGKWQPISWRGTASRVASLAAGLRSLGLVPGDRVMLVSENRPEWLIADLAIMAAGCVTVPTYTTNTERDHLHILENSGARAVFVSTPKLAKTLVPALLDGGSCKHVIGIEDLRVGQAGALAYHQMDTLIAAHPDAPATHDSARSDLACIIYTSGTGGAPRGVRLHHGSLLCNIEGALEVLETDFAARDEEIFLSFLPASHAYEHTAGQLLPIAFGAQIYYSEGLEKLASNIEEVRPTIMIVVPRLFEVLRQRLINAVEKQGGAARFLLDKAVEIGMRRAAGEHRLSDMAFDLLLDQLLRPKAQKRFGGRIKAMVSGGAPLNPEIGIFFESIGLTLLQGYGQTECGPIATVNRPSVGLAMHTVGVPLKGVELRIAEDGEILLRGECVMHGYWENPDETARALQDGWLHTGDIGHLDDKGRLVITDRKKDIIVNDKGDNVAPQRVEGMITLQPEIMQAMVSGDKRPYLVGLVVPDPEWVRGWASANGKPDDLAVLRDDPAFHKALSASLDRVNAGLSVIEKVRRFIVADEPFTIENSQLTPSLKIRRHMIREIYGERLDGLYRGS